MELPLYLSFNEFEKYYYDNLEKWFGEYHNSSETDYLKALSELYSPYLYYNFSNGRLQADASIQIKDCFFPYYDKIGISFCTTTCEKGKAAKNAKYLNHQFEWKTITMMEYAQHVLDKINRYLTKNNIKDSGNILDFINQHDIITSREGAGYCVDYNKHQSTLPFLKAYLPVHGQTVNIALYRDFLFSVVQIAECIDHKLKEVRAFESTLYAKLKSEAKFKVQMSHQFLTMCN
ncbi:hypothetical protein QE422_003629 [Chryseobacterium sp. SORGH_AS 447]|uniref:hypothetical protein n=1 Tax=Chryseobacterium sp. SORGH_AS_0447 TaxID=3041769 RepID=UPI00277FBF07|nr:hypothetical protein [Chryseobacterium sp. SORGH_AS_0447]MDQ1163261.1 hypothetical protein [Chryseobacterium sp. SORGH_AS_0447]